MSKEAMKLALEALENWVEYFPQNVDDIDKKAITALETALAEQPAQQEYASFAEWAHDYVQDNLHKLKPAQRTWQGLTDEEIEKLTVELRDIPVTLAFAIEAKLKEKNT